MTDAQFDEFMRLLRTTDAALAKRILGVYHHIATEIRWLKEARESVPNSQIELRRLAQIAQSSAKLAATLKISPVARLLLVGRLEKPMNEIVSLLDEISKAANDLSDSDTFREEMFLPATDKSAASEAALALWPRAFKTWLARGNKLSYTAGGPLNRFLDLLHIELELPAPTASAIREAVKRHMTDRKQILLSNPDSAKG